MKRWTEEIVTTKLLEFLERDFDSLANGGYGPHETNRIDASREVVAELKHRFYKLEKKS